MAKQFYGIDLGTTYSCIARIDELGKPEVLRNLEGNNTTPSVVFFESADSVVVGSAAKEVAVLYPDRVISTVKRMMGSPDWVTEQHGKEYQAQGISAFILRKLVEDASNNLKLKAGEEIKDVVITCPAYFGLPERMATEQAGTIAGLNVHYIIPEPTAAAIAYSMDESENQTIVVYDLGGGTFDVTVLRVEDKSIDAVCVNGDDRLGGKNWDEKVAQWLAHQFSDETGVSADDLFEDMETWQELLKTAEEAKIRLSVRESVSRTVVHGGNRVAVTLTRETFDELTLPLLERTLSLTQECLEDAAAKNEKYARIDKLLLVGGSTFMPQVKNAVKDKFGFDVSFHEPNEAVAKGAALMALKYAFERESGFSPSGVSQDFLDKKIRNVAAKSFGVVIVDKGELRVNNLIVKNSAVPAKGEKSFGTAEDGQTGVRVRCIENEHTHGPNDPTIDLDLDQQIGEVPLELGRPVHKGYPVVIRFRLREDVMLEVSAKDAKTGREITAEFKSSAILTPEEVEKKKEHHAGITVS